MPVKPKKVKVPATRDPFVNTPLLPIGKGPDGQERFWISTWNTASGTLAVSVTPGGDYRIYPFSRKHGGFYSAVPADRNTLWLCGWLSSVVKLDLRDGSFQEYPTGAPHALIFQGMVYDRPTGKLFGGALPVPNHVAFTFDTKRKTPIRLFENEWLDNYMRFSFPNGDGTWTIVFTTPGVSFVRWDPRTDSIKVRRLQEEHDAHSIVYPAPLFADKKGQYYIPDRGWLEPKSGRITDRKPRPEKTMTWFGRHGDHAFGSIRGKEITTIYRWDLNGKRVNPFCDIPNSGGFNLTAGGSIISVNMYGCLQVFDGTSGALKLARDLPTDRPGRTDCVVRIDKDRLLGTPFITQRFWEKNMKTGEALDCGKAAPGSGEILETWKIGGKIYMAAYTGSELMEYDPQRPPNFPENPRVVAAPVHAMRPVSAADDGHRIFYSCSSSYGTLGSSVVKYDTRTGQADYSVNPVPFQQVRSLVYDRPRDQLAFGTSMHADCQSAPPRDDFCFIGVMDAANLKVKRKVKAPAGTEEARVIGPLGRNRFLVQIMGAQSGWLTVDAADLKKPALKDITPWPAQTRITSYAGKSGHFVILRGNTLELWKFPAAEKVKIIGKSGAIHKICIQDKSIYGICDREILIFERVLP